MTRLRDFQSFIFHMTEKRIQVFVPLLWFGLFVIATTSWLKLSSSVQFMRASAQMFECDVLVTKHFLFFLRFCLCSYAFGGNGILIELPSQRATYGMSTIVKDVNCVFKTSCACSNGKIKYLPARGTQCNAVTTKRTKYLSCSNTCHKYIQAMPCPTVGYEHEQRYLLFRSSIVRRWNAASLHGQPRLQRKTKTKNKIVVIIRQPLAINCLPFEVENLIK